MRRSFTQLYVHLVWATWDRLPLIGPALRGPLYRAIQSEARRMGCEVGAVGGVEDHVHVLARCAPTVAVSELAKQIKGASSHLVHQRLAPGEFFKWQGGYGAFSLARRDVDRVREYVHRQEEHHRSGTLLTVLERTHVE